jgi:drug/metabolite transporter (DMT)-like permease
MKSHLIAVFQALFVVFLWATSWVLIKIGLRQISPLVFAGLRYTLAFICLLLAFFFSRVRKELPIIPPKIMVRLILLGLLFYAGTQGASFVALAYLPAVTVNLLWSFSSVIVALLGIAWLSEKPSLLQWGGVILAMIGAFIYFYPIGLPQNQWIGAFVAVGGVLANAVSSILGREVNRSAKYHPLVITLVSMGIGSIVLLSTGVLIEGIPTIDLKDWAIIIWLALINTAFAFTLWNHTLRTLTAMESSIINGTMLIWIPILAVIFLGENLGGKEVAGLLVAGLGTLIVQIRNIPLTGKGKSTRMEDIHPTGGRNSFR